LKAEIDCFGAGEIPLIYCQDLPKQWQLMTHKNSEELHSAFGKSNELTPETLKKNICSLFCLGFEV